MKYRIKSRKKNERQFPISQKKLRLAAKNSLVPIRTIIYTEEKIFFGEDGYTPKNKRKNAKRLDLRALLKKTALRLNETAKKAVRFIKKSLSDIAKIKKRLLSFIERKANEADKKRAVSIPTVLGALCGCITAASLTLGVFFLYLFAPYAKKRETIIIPDLEGKQISEFINSLENINLTVEYENNPDLSEGTVISQSAPAGATRRINGESGYYDLKVTVCKKEELKVPAGLVGLPLRDATLALKNQGLSFEVTEEYSKSHSKNTVISVYPRSGEEVDRTTKIKLTVSLGEKESNLIVPDLSGLGENEAQRSITLSGFKIGSIIYSPSEKPLGTVISQSLRPHTYAPEGSVISIWVAST